MHQSLSLSSEIKMERWILSWEGLRDRLLKEMQEEIKHNELEHPFVIYMILFIHAYQVEKRKVDMYGYLFWREHSGEIGSEILEQKSLEFKL